MSNADTPSFPDFGKFVPGFDFLQNLATQSAGSTAQKTAAMPNLGSWVAPTINVEELDKRIQELKAVQFWLDQNATALKATIQALEVQKMTLNTLKGMNFNMADMADAFKLKVAGSTPAADKSRLFPGLEIPPTSYQQPEAEDDIEEGEEAEQPEAPAPKPRNAKTKANANANAPSATAAAPGVVDPMQWWGALTQQFQAIAADAMKDAAKKASISTHNNPVAAVAKEVTKAAAVALRSTQAWPTPAAAKKSPAKASLKASSKASAGTAAKTASRAKPKAAVKKPARKSAR